MSKYAHHTEEELRKELKSCINYRRTLKLLFTQKEKRAKEMLEEAEELKSSDWRMGQKESALRLWLARKELEK